MDKKTKPKLTLKTKSKKKKEINEKDLQAFVAESPLEKIKAQTKKEYSLKPYPFKLFQHEIDTVEELRKKSLLDVGRNMNRTEIIRAGIAALSNISDKQFKKIIRELPVVKPGRK